ncbi:MAG: phage recombination protein Bet [Gammaproteobacteria bacterium]|nr:phage recombination protein Bet [Gammaproteobacteria bacterium]
MKEFEEITGYIMSLDMSAGNTLLKNVSIFMNKEKMVGIEIDKKKKTADGFMIIAGGERDYGNLSDEVIAIVDKCRNMIKGEGAKDAPGQGSEQEDEYVEADYEIVNDTAEQEKETKQTERKQMKETAIEPVHQDQNAALSAVDALPITLETVKAHICKTASDQELKLFIEICRSHNLNPFIDEIYLIKYPGSAANTVVGKGVFLERAFNNPNFDGFEAGIIVIDEAGKLIRREGAFRLDSETLVGGWARVHMKNKAHPYVNEVRLKDYTKTKKDGTPTKFWKMMAETMIRKVPLTQTLKEAMPGEFNQLWDADALIIDAEVVEK